MNEKTALAMFKALGEETRFLIIKALLEKERCACELPVIIARTQSNTSMHLAKLQDLGLISSRRDGKQIIYSLHNTDVKQLMEMIQ